MTRSDDTVIVTSIWEKSTMTTKTTRLGLLLRISVLAFGMTLLVCTPVFAAGGQSASSFSLSTGPTFGVSGDKLHKNVSETFSIVNGNSRQVFLEKIGKNGPGLELLVASGSGKTRKLEVPSGTRRIYRIPAHKSLRITVWYHVTDCATVPTSSWPLSLDVAWNSANWRRVNLQMPGTPSVPWPRSMTRWVC